MTDKSSSNDSPREEELSLPENLVKLIDERREELTRTEFIELCIKLSLGDKKQELEKYSGPSINRMSENFEKRLRQLTENLDKRFSQISEEMTNRFDYVSEVSDKMGEKSSASVRSIDALDKKLEQLTSSVDSKYDNLAQGIRKDVLETIASRPQVTSDLAERRMEQLEERLEKSILDANDRLDRKLQAISDLLDKRLATLAEKIGQKPIEVGLREQGQNQPLPKFPFSGSQLGGEAVNVPTSRVVSTPPRQNLSPAGGLPQARTGIESNVQFDAIMSSIKQLSESIDKKIDRKIDERLGIASSSTSQSGTSQKSSDNFRRSTVEATTAPISPREPAITPAKTFESSKASSDFSKKFDESGEKIWTAPGARFLRDSNYVGLWLLAIATFGVGDLTTTYFALSRSSPLLSINPIVMLFGSFFSFFIAKVVIVVGVFLISYFTVGKKVGAYAVPLVMAASGILLTLNNMLRLGWI